MNLTGEYRIPAPRAKVWEALNDPEVLKQCIPGCEELNKEGEDAFTAKVTSKVGPVRAKFAGKVTLTDIDAPNGYTIRGEGQGGVAGFAKGSADVRLTEEGSDTVLTYAAKAEVGGKLASVGSRLVEGVAKKTADDFFGKFSEIVGNGGGVQGTTMAAPGTGTAAPPDPTAAPMPSADKLNTAEAEALTSGPNPPPPSSTGPYPAHDVPSRSGGISPWMWGFGLVVVIGIIWYLTGR